MRPFARRDGGSLSLRLSAWLAVLAFVGQAAFSAFVYLATASNLEQRQQTELANKERLVRHLVVEADSIGDDDGLRGALEDVGIGYAGVLLRLAPPSASPLFESTGWTLAPLEGQRVLTVEMPWSQAKEGRVVAELRLDAVRDDRLLSALGATLFAAATIGAVAIAALTHALVRRGLSPVAQLTGQLRRIHPGDASVRLDGSAQHTELQGLVEQFNTLLDEVDRAYRQLAAFNVDVAHELRTPLAALIADAEVMMARERSVQEWRDAMGRQLEELDGLAGIVADMLFLARAERTLAARAADVPSLASLVGEVVEFHEAAFEDRTLAVRVDGDAGGRFDAQLIKRAVSNLLSNAARHATPGSVVEVSIEAAHGGAIRVTVRNRGRPIGAEHLPRLFDRFYRADSAREDSIRHHGLGLAIVAAIARMHGGATFARSDPQATEIGFEVQPVESERSARADPRPGRSRRSLARPWPRSVAKPHAPDGARRAGA